jgi:NADH:ubiquinone oxidoreductase subunit 2 (subunit N)
MLALFLPDLVCVIALLACFTFGLVSQRHALSQIFCVWWCFLSGLFFLARWGAGLYTSDLFKALLCFLTCWVLHCSAAPVFEASLLLPFALLGQHFLISSQNLVTFYAGLELPNFAGVVLCALHSRSGFSVEAALLYLLQSAFSSGFLLLGSVLIYIHTGHVDFQSLAHMVSSGLGNASGAEFGLWLFTLGLVWKLGTAPVHHWVVSIYNGAWSGTAFFLSTVPKLGVFWVWQPLCSGIGWIAVLSLFLGALGALGQPLAKPLLAYSTVGMNGLWLLALETSEPSALWVGLGLYMWTLALIWPLLSDPFMLCTTDFQRGMSWVIVSISLAGMPPFLGFLGKATILLSSGLSYAPVVGMALFGSVLSVVYYLFLVMTASMAEVGSILYRTPMSVRPFTTSSIQPSAVIFVSAFAAFWKCAGLRFSVLC